MNRNEDVTMAAKLAGASCHCHYRCITPHLIEVMHRRRAKSARQSHRIRNLIIRIAQAPHQGNGESI